MRDTLRIALLSSIVVPAVAGGHSAKGYVRHPDFPWREGEPCPDTIVARNNAKVDKSKIHNDISVIQKIREHCPAIKSMEIHDNKGDHFSDNTYTFQFQDKDEAEGIPAVKKLTVDNYYSMIEPSEANMDEQLGTYLDLFTTNTITELDIYGRIPFILLNPTDGGVFDVLPKLDTITISHDSEYLDRAINLLLQKSSSWNEASPNSGLTNLTWTGWRPFVVKPLLKYHGATLESLVLKSHEYSYECPDSKSSPSTAHFKQIAEGATKLQHLQVDVNRTCSWPWDNCDWPWDNLQAIASSRTLKSIKIPLALDAKCSRSDSETSGTSKQEPETNEEWMEWISKRRAQTSFTPFLTPDVAQNVFKYMVNRNEARTLERVVFEVSSWDCQERSPRYWSKRFANGFEGSHCAVECSTVRKDGTLKGTDEALCVSTKGGPMAQVVDRVNSRKSRWDDDYGFSGGFGHGFFSMSDDVFDNSGLTSETSSTESSSQVSEVTEETQAAGVSEVFQAENQETLGEEL